MKRGSDVDVAALLATMEGIACAAGRRIVVHAAAAADWTAKPDGSPVTIADKAAEHVIRERLAAEFPGIPVVAEELAAAGGLPVVTGPRFFLVDPLDGTREFVKGSTDYTVNIALVENGEPVAGVIVAPAKGMMFSGAGESATRSTIEADGAVTERTAIRVRRREPGAPLAAVVSVSHMNDATRAFVEGIRVASASPVGSSLKFCLLASGAADIYPRFGQTMQWDTAAGEVILRAAGGVTLTPLGEPLTYGSGGCASGGGDAYRNPDFVAYAGPRSELQALLQRA